MTFAPLVAALALATTLPVDAAFPPGTPARALFDAPAVPLADAIAAWRRSNGGAPCTLHLVVYKSVRRLDARCGAQLVKSYVMNLGGETSLDKVQQGDSATPEGELFVCTKNDKSAFHLFLGLSYPMPEDAERGGKAGLVTPSQAQAIREAAAKKRCPPWNTKLGGAVGIHGSGGHTRAGTQLTLTDWTLGCVAVSDPEIEELFAAAKVGTPVTILRAPPAAGIP